MTFPASAARFAASMDTQEVLDFIIRLAPLLEVGETIDPGGWSMVLLPEAVALGLEIIEGDAEHPDPELIEDGQSIGFWARIDPAFHGNAAFQSGALLPIEVTAWTTATPPRKRQRTVALTVVEQ